jgi:hypothetical protein
MSARKTMRKGTPGSSPSTRNEVAVECQLTMLQCDTWQRRAAREVPKEPVSAAAVNVHALFGAEATRPRAYFMVHYRCLVGEAVCDVGYPGYREMSCSLSHMFLLVYVMQT